MQCRSNFELCEELTIQSHFQQTTRLHLQDVTWIVGVPCFRVSLVGVAPLFNLMADVSEGPVLASDSAQGYIEEAGIFSFICKV